MGGEWVTGERLGSGGEEEVDSGCQRARDLCREQLRESEEQQQRNLSSSVYQQAPSLTSDPGKSRQEVTTRRHHRERERKRECHFTSTDFGRNGSISAPPSFLSDPEDAEEVEEELRGEELAAGALGRLYM